MVVLVTLCLGVAQLDRILGVRSSAVAELAMDPQRNLFCVLSQGDAISFAPARGHLQVRASPGVVSFEIILWNSNTLPGQPCESRMGMASGSDERSWMKCSSIPFTFISKLANEFRDASAFLQSNVFCQYSASSCGLRNFVGEMRRLVFGTFARGCRCVPEG